jgi:DNA-binding NtrC family response regulator
VRELENVMQRAIICADSQELQPANLPPQIHVPHDVLHPDGDLNTTGTFERLLRDYKVKLAIKAIEECHGNKTLAARSLDISRAYLHRLIRQNEEVGIGAA